MARYIDAEALKEKFNEYSIIHAVIDGMPAADVRENMHGRWIYDYEYNGEDEIPVAVCSVCEKSVYDFMRSNFCPNCGADMRGER